VNRQLPPLKALRAFEAAGRHLSLSKAAQELHVSAGAVSQQVKLLETFVATRLFERQHRQIVLTESGHKLLPGITAALDQILHTVNSVKQESRDRPLTVSAAPSFAARWLVPRLQDFNQKHPDIDVRIDTSTDLVDLVHSDIDIGIRFGSGHYPGLRKDFLTCQEVLPVCAPSLVESGLPLDHPNDLKHYQLLHYDQILESPEWPDWQMWLAAAGAKEVPFNRGPRFVEVNLLIDAAIQGQGIALAGSVSVNDAIQAGQLIKPFDVVFPLTFAFYFVTAKSRADESRITAFREWMLDAIEAGANPDDASLAN
jgi:LysR family glycine cleavage system transcriptional activator